MSVEKYFMLSKQIIAIMNTKDRLIMRICMLAVTASIGKFGLK